MRCLAAVLSLKIWKNTVKLSTCHLVEGNTVIFGTFLTAHVSRERFPVVLESRRSWHTVSS